MISKGLFFLLFHSELNISFDFHRKAFLIQLIRNLMKVKKRLCLLKFCLPFNDTRFFFVITEINEMSFAEFVWTDFESVSRRQMVNKIFCWQTDSVNFSVDEGKASPRTK